MTTATSDLLLPGYWVDEASAAWCSIPWPSDPDEKMALVRSSLGPALIDWSEGRTDRPGLIHYMSGKAWRWTPGQRRFLILWYALDKSGRFIYRSGVKRGAKGTGKDPMAGAMCNTELVGDVEPYDWDDETGRPVGRARGFPLVQVMSNSEAQSRDVLRIANAMWSQEARGFYDLDCGETRTVLKSNGGRFEIPPAAEASGEGDPATFVALNEALALDTPVPTPTGWSTMGELRVGDAVLGADGLPAEVTKATETFRSRRCYRVTFLDGDSVIADAGHLWEARRSGWPAWYSRVMTTEEMAATPGRVRVPLPKPANLPEADLPLEPYVLGAWLGDGSSEAPVLTTSHEDMAWWLSELPRLGYPTRHRRSTRTGEEVTMAGEPHSWAQRGNGVRATLAGLGVLGRKFIPAAYLRASIDQRLALLQGLVDTDGCVTTTGRVVFVNTNENLAGGVAELARSLGHVVHVSLGQDIRKASYLPCWRVQWQGDSAVPSARMPRKARRLRAVTSHGSLMTVKSVEAVESVPVRCISVGNDSHLFLVGGWKVTHNSHHMTDSSGGKRVAAMGRRNVGKSPASIQARLCEFTNAHRQGYGSVAEDSFAAFQGQLTAGYRGKRDLLYDSIEAPPGTDILTDEGRMAGAVAAYSDADWADLERICDEMMDARTSVADTIRFYLNGLAAEEDSWVEPAAFDTLAAGDTVVADRDRIALFLDCSKSEDATGLMACRLSDMFVFQIDGHSVWQRPHGDRGKGWLAPRAEVDAKVRAAMDRYDVVWFGVDPSPARDDATETLYWMTLIDQWHRDFHKKLPIWATPGAGGSSVLFDMRLSQSGGVKRNQSFTLAAEIVARWIDEEGIDGPLRHDGSAILRTHVHNARRRPNSWGVSLGKVTRDSNKLVDLAVCMVGAVMGARESLNSPKLKRQRKAGGQKIVVLS